MRVTQVIRRFFIPGWFVTIACYMRTKAMVSPRAEVELGSNLRLARGVAVGSFCKIKVSDGPVAIGEHTSLATGCFVSAGAAGIRIGEDCLIGPNCVIVASNYVYTRLAVPLRLQGSTSQGIRIGRNVQLAANCTVLDGSIIGDNVIISANSVVSGAIAANVVAAGSPARTLFARR